MKIRVIRQITDGNETFNPGQEADVLEVVAKTYIAAGWAEPVAEESSGDEPTKPAKRGQLNNDA